jgi:hypothetical protein
MEGLAGAEKVIALIGAVVVAVFALISLKGECDDGRPAARRRVNGAEKRSCTIPKTSAAFRSARASRRS